MKVEENINNKSYISAKFNKGKVFNKGKEKFNKCSWVCIQLLLSMSVSLRNLISLVVSEQSFE